MALIDRLVRVNGDLPRRQDLVYKYCRHERVDILQNLKFRLTQPGAFNDPFEGYPYTRSFTDGELANHIAQNEELPAIWHAGLLRLYKDGLLDRQWSLEEVVRDPLRAGRLLWERLRVLREAHETSVDRRHVGHLWLFDRMLGLACFSEVRDDIVMWGLYAEGHTGFVLGFDAAHEFFTSSKFGLRPVEYSDQRPVMALDEVWNLKFHLTKATPWSHEREWRLISPIPLTLPPETPMDSLGYPIVLADFPSSLLRCVIVGARTPDACRQKIVGLLSEPILAHVELLQASLDPRSFRVSLGHATLPRPSDHALQQTA